MTSARGRDRWRQGRGTGGRCRSGKMRYRNRTAAESALAVIVRKDDPGHTEARAYACPQCGGWHLTSRA